MAFSISTQQLIQASPARVWDILMDFPKYPEWNPFIRRIEGVAKPGHQIEVLLQPPGGKPMTFRPLVLVVDEQKEFRWKGKLLFKGLFDGEHIFQLSAQEDGSTLLIHSENFSGLLLPLLRKQLDSQTPKGFIEMNLALRGRAEG